MHKIKLFADDLKVFIINLPEIDLIEEVIDKFETVSGIKHHREPSRDKCQALSFGEHRYFTGWGKWPWITVKNTIKVVGAYFSNEKDIDKLNTELACQNFHLELSKSYGIQGTVFQKTYLVNTYLF